MLERYVKYIARHFGEFAVVVFDGYMNGPTIKDYEHDRRSCKACPDYVFDESTPVCCSQASFLANEKNKMQFVTLLKQRLEARHYCIFQAQDDADTLIVATALDVASRGKPVFVVANDTDILVLLMYHFDMGGVDIILQFETKKATSAQTIRRSVRELCKATGSVATRQLLVAHAISGCDTTSSLFGHGKASVWKQMKKSPNTTQLTETISSDKPTQKEIVAAGMQLLSLLYSGKTDNKINHLRYTMYMNMIATRSRLLRPERLPPTENAARFHILRVHLQVMQWKSLMTTNIKPEDWGWKIVDGRYKPVDTDLDAAPSDLLKVIKCSCKMEAGRPCTSQLCTCFKHGLPCLPACKHCYGELCGNAHITETHQTLDPIEEGVIITANGDDSEEVDNLEQSMLCYPHMYGGYIDDCTDHDIPWLDEEIVE